MFILTNEIMFNVIASLTLQCSDPWVCLVPGEVIPNSTCGAAGWGGGCSLGALLMACWLKVPLKEHSAAVFPTLQGVKSRKTSVDEGETVSCPWLRKRFLLSYRSVEGIWAKVRPWHLELSSLMWGSSSCQTKCAVGLYWTIGPQFLMAASQISQASKAQGRDLG